MAVHKNSLENLKKARRFTSETAPKGRKNAGLSVNEWRNQLADYSRDEIESVVNSPTAPASKLIAAQEIIQAIKGDTSSRRDLCDYTNGKPTQREEHSGPDGDPIKIEKTPVNVKAFAKELVKELALEIERDTESRNREASDLARGNGNGKSVHPDHADGSAIVVSQR